MALAPDGRQYDVDILRRRPRPTEIEVIQYLRPDRRRRKLFFDAPACVVAASRDMVVSAEIDEQDIVSVYVRWKDEPEEKEAVDSVSNAPGKKNPPGVVIDLIMAKLMERKQEGGEHGVV